MSSHRRTADFVHLTHFHREQLRCQYVSPDQFDIQESPAVAKKPRDAAAVLFGLRRRTDQRRYRTPEFKPYQGQFIVWNEHKIFYFCITCDLPNALTLTLGIEKGLFKMTNFWVGSWGQLSGHRGSCTGPLFGAVDDVDTICYFLAVICYNLNYSVIYFDDRYL